MTAVQYILVRWTDNALTLTGWGFAWILVFTIFTVLVIARPR